MALIIIITKWYDETHFYKKIMVEDEALQEPLNVYRKSGEILFRRFYGDVCIPGIADQGSVWRL